MNILKKTLIGAVAAFAFATSAQSQVMTDIIMVVDESGSMGNVQVNLRNNIAQFASILSAGGIDAQYGLVGYGNGAVNPRTLTDLTSAANFATAAQNLVASGGTEPGYTASAYALNQTVVRNPATDITASFSFRNNAIKNIILFTDEPSNGENLFTVNGTTPVTEALLDGILTDTGAFFNAVLRGTSTIASYEQLALDHNGQVFDLNGLNTTDQTVVQQFVSDFADAKLQEILDFCDLNPTDPACIGGPGNVPVPAPLALIGIGLVFFGLRKRAAA